MGAPPDLRAIFDEDPELYQRARPGYPVELFDDLREAGVRPGARVLEIGRAPGRPRPAWWACGAQVVAVELGPGLAATLRRRFAGVEVIVSTFEEWPPPDEPFDAVAGFTSWHWLHPALRTAKAATLLRPGGILATVTTEHVAGGTDDFFAAVQRCYETWDPATPPGLVLPASHNVPPALDEVDTSPLFELAHPAASHGGHHLQHRRLSRPALYLLGASRPPVAHRNGLLDCIGRLIDDDFGGQVTERYLYELRLARRAA